MFERFTEQARRTLFFARYEASEFGSRSIETEHLLIGLTRESKGLVGHIFAALQIAPDDIRSQIEGRSGFREKVPTSVEIPFSEEIKRIFHYAIEEAERLRHNYIGTEHLLLGILREERSVAGTILIERGMRLESVREQIVTLSNLPIDVESGESDGQSWHTEGKSGVTARYRTFESRTRSWEDLCQDAAAFATEVGRERLINISVAASGGTEMFGHGGRGLIVVWYWE